MRLLLDTHALLWWLGDDKRLGGEARALIGEPGNDVIVSTVSLWEIVVKQRVGKLSADLPRVLSAVERGSFTRLDISPAHLRTLGELPTHHRDPFDHLLIAQAMVEAAVLLSEDGIIGRYPVRHMTCSNAGPITR